MTETIRDSRVAVLEV